MVVGRTIKQICLQLKSSQNSDSWTLYLAPLPTGTRYFYFLSDLSSIFVSRNGTTNGGRSPVWSEPKRPMNYRTFIRAKFIFPFLALLKQGLIPSKLALVISLGICISIFPVLGITTVICAFLAIVFRLNLPAIQLVNYMVFPFQIILFFPFLKIGEMVSGISLERISEATMVSHFESDFFQAFEELYNYIILACLGWSIVIIPLFFVLYFIILVLIKKYFKLHTSFKSG